MNIQPKEFIALFARYMERCKAIATLLLMACAFILSACGPSGRATGGVQGKVVGIKDGDTFEILIDGKAEVVRLAHIDCPERGQPFGKAAKQFASDLCFGKDVIVKEEGKRDRYGRMIAVVKLQKGPVVNKELVRAGLAWHFTRYSSDGSYTRLEQQARAARAGLWAGASPIPPWDWRKPGRRTREQPGTKE